MVTCAPGPGAAALAQEPRPWAPLEQPGPVLAVAQAELDASLQCSPDVVAGVAETVLLIPGTTLTPATNYDWNWLPAFQVDGRPHCTVELPGAAMVDIQTSAEYVVHALRAVTGRTGGLVDVVGYSQGGMIGRWALRFWPDTRALVDDLVGLAPSNHGTLTAIGPCATPCPPAFRQQIAGSTFVQALNSLAETHRGIDYTVIYTQLDQVVTPNLDDSGSSALHTGGGTIVNVALQDVCPGHPADHFTIGTTDAVAYALAVDALDHEGPADPGRIPLTVCAEPFMPGVDPAELPANEARLLQQVVTATAGAEQVAVEPPLRAYAFASPDRVERVAGPDRVATAIAFSQAGFGDGAPAAVLARADDFADALTASALAVAAGGPILLTGPDALDGAVASELERLGVERVYLAGGPVALSPAVAEAVGRDGEVEVLRVDGGDRFATAAALAGTAAALRGSVPAVTVAVGARSDGADAWPDALGAGNLAATTGQPTLLVTPSAVPAATLDALAELLAPGGSVLLVGGERAVGAVVEEQLRAAGYAVERVAGDNRYATAALLAGRAARAGAEPGPVVLASGTTFADALVAAPLLAVTHGRLLLTPPDALGPDAAAALHADREAIDLVQLAGGPAALSDAVAADALAAMRDAV